MSDEYRSVLGQKARTALSPALVLAVIFHVAVFAAAFFLPRFFDKPPAMRKPIMAKLVAQGMPRDTHLLPRKETAPPSALAAAPASVPSTHPSSAKTAPAVKHAPTRQELMERALAAATGKVSAEKDDERPGEKKGSPEGTAQSAEEGDAYFTAVHDAILENYVVPSVISERERLYLSASVLAWIGKDGQLVKHEFQKKSGNAFFDAALENAIQRTKLPPPPADLQRELRDTGIVLNFRP